MNPIKRSWIWEEYLKLISVAGFKFFLKKELYCSNRFLNWRIFSLPFPGWSSDIRLPWNTTPCDDPSSFLCFSVWKSLAVVEILLSEMTSWFIPIQWFHLLQPCWQHRKWGKNPLPTLVEHLLVLLTSRKAKGSSRPSWLMFWSYCYKCRWDSVLLSVDLWGELNSCRKSKYGTIYLKKKVSSNFIMLENSVPSTVCSPAVIMLSPRLRRIMQINVKKGGRDVILSVIDFNNNQYN